MMSFISSQIKSILLFIGLAFNAAVLAETKNGFDLKNSLIPAEQILHGGPPRDGIPAINRPIFVNIKNAHFIKDKDRILGIHQNGISKAYPISIMNWHETVNDVFHNKNIIITYCPLCGTGIAFISQHDQFGVSGLLYNSDVLLYDRKTESLWSQILGKAITGPLKNTKIEQITLEHTRWGDWRNRHPDTLVLSTDTGYQRDYQRDPYAGYSDNKKIFFPVAHHDPRYHPKEQVIGLELNGHFKVYPFSELAKTSGMINDQINGQEISIHFDAKNQSARILTANEQALPTITGYWFAWMAFHPDSDVFQVR